MKFRFASWFGLLAGVGLFAQLATLHAQPSTLNSQPASINHVLDLDGNGSYVELPPHIFDELTEATVIRYRQGGVGLSDLMQALTRESQTANNLLNAYRGYQNTLRRLKEVTFFDFEAGQPLVERFKIAAGK